MTKLSKLSVKHSVNFFINQNTLDNVWVQQYFILKTADDKLKYMY